MGLKQAPISPCQSTGILSPRDRPVSSDHGINGESAQVHVTNPDWLTDSAVTARPSQNGLTVVSHLMHVLSAPAYDTKQ